MIIVMFFFLHIDYGTYSISFLSSLISIYIGLNGFILSIYIYIVLVERLP